MRKIIFIGIVCLLVLSQNSVGQSYSQTNRLLKNKTSAFRELWMIKINLSMFVEGKVNIIRENINRDNFLKQITIPKIV